MEADLQRYLNLVTSQHKPRPRFMATLRAFLSPFDATRDAIRSIPSSFDVYTASGKQLDIIGERVGVERSFPDINFKSDMVFLDDEMFRKVVLMKIVQNQWDGTDGTFREVWQATLGSLLNADYTDNQDMTMDVAISGRLELLLAELIKLGYIIPRPMGVGITVTAYATSDAPAYMYARTAPVSLICRGGGTAIISDET